MAEKTTDETTDKALVGLGPGGPLTPSPVFRGAHMVRALADYRELQKALDEAMPDQLMVIGDRSFRKKGYWRAIAVAFGLTVEPAGETRSVIGALDDGTENYLHSVTYRATAPNGRATTGDGACAAAEKQRGRMEATEHNVRSHAHTRAFNRAVSNLVGFGEVSAEEVERDEHAEAAKVRPDGRTHVSKIEEKTGTSKQGKAWTRFTVLFEDGRSGSTFDRTLVEMARKCLAGKVLVVPTLEHEGQFTNLKGLAPVPPEPAGNGEPTPEGEAVINPGQLKRFWAIAKEHKWEAEQVALVVLRPRGYAQTKDAETEAPLIKAKDYEAMCQELKAGPPKASDSLKG
jgi:hypothetical protein